MVEEQKTAKEKANATAASMSCMEMMSQMCGECKDWSPDMCREWMNQQGQGDYIEMMSRMMSGFTGAKAVTEDKAANEDAEKA